MKRFISTTVLPIAVIVVLFSESFAIDQTANKCPIKNEPVCVTGNKTLPNQYAACEKYKSDKTLRIISFDKCSKPETGNACTKIYQPVCGSDNITYPNLCVLKVTAKSCPCILPGSVGECNSGTAVTNTCDCTY